MPYKTIIITGASRGIGAEAGKSPLVPGLRWSFLLGLQML